MDAIRSGTVWQGLGNESVGHLQWFLTSGQESGARLQVAKQMGDGFAKVLEEEMK